MKDPVRAGERRALVIRNIHEQTLSKDMGSNCHFAVSSSGFPSALTAVCA